MDRKVQTTAIIIKKQKDCRIHCIDETLIKVGSEYVWLSWIAIEPETRQILAVTVSRERNMLITERFLSGLIKDYGKHPVSTDGGGTWYPQGCEFLKLKHHIHSSLEKSLIERTIQYIKDRTESFDDYFPYRKQNCKLEHIKQWITVFAWHHNNNIRD
ncbi:MAG: DDE-type integrase/transposase/recombinase [Candidatus Nitrosocosmicus sp.]|nr:DDE-type integrase/transposase/recombinase [Candidatus Nitrosocosmicus sp.]